MTYIVAVRILYESESIVSDLVDELDFLVIRCVINAALEDAAAMTVSGNFNTVGSNRIINELVENKSKKKERGERASERMHRIWIPEIAFSLLT